MARVSSKELEEEADMLKLAAVVAYSTSYLPSRRRHCRVAVYVPRASFRCAFEPTALPHGSQ